MLPLLLTLTLAVPAADVTPLPNAHAHNDYAHARPLLDALDHGFCSVEADIFLVKDELLVGHTTFDLRPERTLEKLYLEPLRERVRLNKGQVYPGGPELLLLIDLKTDGKTTYAALHKLLERYDDVFSCVREGTVERRAVTAVISGNRPIEMIREQKVRYAAIDGRPTDLDSTDPAHLLPLLSASWSSLFKWTGDGAFPETERDALRKLVRLAHERGRKVRLWATPEKEAVWKELRDAGVDYLNTDRLGDLRRFLLARADARQESTFFLKNRQRVVFLGDSNTFAGHFVAYLDAYLYTRFPTWKVELINLGLPSETVSGLSEPDHPYPRPDVHERIDRALEKSKPDVVVVCYGMNDGIYHPFDEGRFKKYQNGIRDVVERVRKVGATPVLMSPAPFDPKPLKGKVQPKSDDRFSWMKPYEDYDEVLARYSDWLLTWREKGLTVVDAHAAVRRYLDDVRRTEPNVVLSGDGIHPNPTGHWLVAQEILIALDAAADADAAGVDAKDLKALHGKVAEVVADGGGVRFVWESRLPLPIDPRWDAKLPERVKIADRLSRLRLTVTRLSAGKYTLSEGETRLGEFSAEELADGIDLTRLKDLSLNRRAAEVGKLATERQKLIGVAWLTEVGHKRPDTPKGLPLAEAQKKAAAMEEQARKLATPVRLSLRIVPVEK